MSVTKGFATRLGGGSPAILRWQPWAEGRFAMVGFLVILAGGAGAVAIGSALNALGFTAAPGFVIGTLGGGLAGWLHRSAGLYVAGRQVLRGVGMSMFSLAVALILTTPLTLWLWGASRDSKLALAAACMLVICLVLLQLGPLWAHLMLRGSKVMHDYRAAEALLAELNALNEQPAGQRKGHSETTLTTTDTISLEVGSCPIRQPRSRRGAQPR